MHCSHFYLTVHSDHWKSYSRTKKYTIQCKISFKELKETYNAGIFMRITLIHLDIFASNEQKPKMAILMPDWICTQMINPPKILKIPFFFISHIPSSANTTIVAAVASATAGVGPRSLAAQLLYRRRRFHPSLSLSLPSLSVLLKLSIYLHIRWLVREKDRERVCQQSTESDMREIFVIW